MASRIYLFRVTHWLLTVATVLLLLFTVLMVVAEGGVTFALVTVNWNILPLPATMGGFTRETVLWVAVPVLAMLGIGALVLALICHLTARIVASAMLGDPFVGENATRLTQIGWLLVGLEVAGVLAGLCADALPEVLKHNMNFDPDFSPVGIMGILLIFVLAQVFRRGSEMRAELEGTV